MADSTTYTKSILLSQIEKKYENRSNFEADFYDQETNWNGKLYP